jgi:hypothetical protein
VLGEDVPAAQAHAPLAERDLLLGSQRPDALTINGSLRGLAAATRLGSPTAPCGGADGSGASAVRGAHRAAAATAMLLGGDGDDLFISGGGDDAPGGRPVPSSSTAATASTGMSSRASSSARHRRET